LEVGQIGQCAAKQNAIIQTVTKSTSADGVKHAHVKTVTLVEAGRRVVKNAGIQTVTKFSFAFGVKHAHVQSAGLGIGRSAVQNVFTRTVTNSMIYLVDGV
jgi:hypothetical protein